MEELNGHDSQSTSCNHKSLNATMQFTTNSDGSPLAFVDLKVECALCGEPFVFTMCSPPAVGLRLAIAPASAVASARRIVVPNTLDGMRWPSKT